MSDTFSEELEDFDIWFNTVLDELESAGITVSVQDADCFEPAYKAGRCAHDVAIEYAETVIEE